MKSNVETSFAAVDCSSKKKVVIIKKVESAFYKNNLNHTIIVERTSYFTNKGQEINKTNESEFTFANNEARKISTDEPKKKSSFFNENKLNDIKVFFDTLRNTSICIGLFLGILIIRDAIKEAINKPRDATDPIFLNNKEIYLDLNTYLSFAFMAFIILLLFFNLGWMSYSIKEKSKSKLMHWTYLAIMCITIGIASLLIIKLIPLEPPLTKIHSQ